MHVSVCVAQAAVVLSAGPSASAGDVAMAWPESVALVRQR